MALMGHGAFNSNKIFHFNYIINKIRKKVGKSNNYKMRQKFITKCVRFFIAKCDSYYELRQFYYKVTKKFFLTFCTMCPNEKYVIDVSKLC